MTEEREHENTVAYAGGESMEEGGDYNPGLHDPDSQKFKKKSNLKLYGGLFLFLLFFAGIGYYMTADFVASFKSDKKPVPGQEISVAESTYMQMLAEREELLKRIQSLEKEQDDVVLDIENRVAAGIARAMQDFRGLDDLSSRLDASERQNAEVTAALKALQEQLALKEAEERVPMQGSRAESTLYSGLSEWRGRIAKTEEDLAAAALVEPRFVKSPGVQLGSAIPAKLLTTLISSTVTEGFYATAETVEPVRLGRGFALPAGVRFLGKIRSDFQARRIFVDVERMQYGEVDIPVQGIMLDARGNPGLITKYVDPLNSAAWSMLLPNILSAAASAAQDMVSYYDRDGYRREEPEFSGKNVALQGIADTMAMQSNIMFEVGRRKHPVILVHSGIDIQIQMTGRVPLDLLIEAGVVEQVQ